jgi:fibro-slime domain-containing protein
MRNVGLCTLGLVALAGCAEATSTFGPDPKPSNGNPGTISLGTSTIVNTGTGQIGNLTVILRDFRFYNSGDKSTNPDFENPPKTDQNGNPNPTYTGPWHDLAIVTDTLGDDNLPVYANSNGSTVTTHGKKAFDQWFRDVKGTNIRVEYPLLLTQNASGNYFYDSQISGVPVISGGVARMFFPLDNGSPYQTAFGNQGSDHNFSFTLEMHTRFVYQGGEFFHFRGDDDVFVYINKKLVINLGGIHSAEQADVQIDSLGLEKGVEYPLDFFYAERHVAMSNLLITTSLALTPVVIY